MGDDAEIERQVRAKLARERALLAEARYPYQVWAVLEPLEKLKGAGDLSGMERIILQDDPNGFSAASPFSQQYNSYLNFLIEGLKRTRGIEAVHHFVNRLIRSRERYARPRKGDSASKRIERQLDDLPYLLEIYELYLKFLNENELCMLAERVREAQQLAAENRWPERRTFARESREMNEDLFWEIIDSTLRDEDGRLDLDELIARLTACRKAKIVKWYKVLQEELTRAHTSEIWEVGYAMNGGLGDDGFEYFKCWLVTQGREFFERFLENPAETALTVSPGVEMDGEWLLEVAQDACAELGADFPETAGVKEEKKRAKLNLVIDEESIPNRYRRIWDHFGGSRGA